MPQKAAAVTFDDGYKDNYVYACPIIKKYDISATIFLATGHIGTGDLFWWDKVGYVVHNTSARRLRAGEIGTYRLESPSDRDTARLALIEKLRRLPEGRKNLLIERLVDLCRVDIPDGLGAQLNLSWDEVVEMNRRGIDVGAHTVTHSSLTGVSESKAGWEISQSKSDIERRIGKRVDLFAYPNGDFDERVVELVTKAGFAAGVTTAPTWVTGNTDPYRIGRVTAIEDLNAFRVMLCGLWGDLHEFPRRLML